MRSILILSIMLFGIVIASTESYGCTATGSLSVVHACESAGGAITSYPYAVGSPNSMLKCTLPTTPPTGSINGPYGPNCGVSSTAPDVNPRTTKTTCETGSIIDVGGQGLAEEIPIAGSLMFLRYDSSRSFGYGVRRAITMPVTDTTPITTVASAAYKFEYLGRTTTNTVTSFPANTNVQFLWDGKDAAGVPTGVSACVATTVQTVKIAPVCDSDGHCEASIPGGKSSGGGCSIPGGGTFVGGWIAKRLGLGGWTLSGVHHYDIVREMIDLGDGRSIKVNPGFVGSNFRIGFPDSNDVFIFGPTGLHLQTLNSRTGSVKFSMTYTSDERLLTVTDAYSRVTTVQYDGSNQPTKIVGPFGHETLLQVDADGFLSKATYPDLTYYQMAYGTGTSGLLATFQKPGGQVSSFTYDSMGKLIQDNGPDGFVSTLAKSPGSPGQFKILHTSGTGVVTRHEYFTSNNQDTQQFNRFRQGGQELLSITDAPTSRSTAKVGGYASGETFAFDPQFGPLGGKRYLSQYQYTQYSGYSLLTTIGKVVSFVSGTGPFNIATMTTTRTKGGLAYQEIYSGPANTLKYKSPLLREINIQLNSQERPTSIQEADFTPTTYTYNSSGQVSNIARGSRYTALTYNTAGLVSISEDSLGQQTSYTYDSRDRLLTTTLPDTRVITNTWDANGNLTSISPPTRSPHGFSLNASETVSSYNPPSIGGVVSTLYDYDIDRRLKKITRPSGSIINLTYSQMNLSGMSNSLGNYTFQYDGSSNNLKGSTSPYGITVSRTLIGDFLDSESVTGNGKGRLSFSIDSKLRPLTVNVMNASGSTVLSGLTYGYDNDSLLTSAGGLTLTRHSTRGHVTGLALGSVSEMRSYNSFNEIAAQTATYSSTTLYDSAITRDVLGRVSTNTETIGGVTTVYGYAYNSVGRLTNVTRNGSAYSSYAYDGNGNRTSRTLAGGTDYATTDGQDRLLTHGNYVYTYNQNGELATKTDTALSLVTTYTYDPSGNLKRVDLPTGTYIEYLYDGFDRRMVKKINGTVDRYFVYQNQLQLTAELDGSGNLIARYVYGSRSSVPDYVVKAGVNYRIISDQIGNVRLVVNSTTGAVAQQIDFDEFGRISADSSPGFQAFGFAGGVLDQGTRLTHFGARDYDAETGRWLSKDPIGFRGGDANLYGYVINDPINFIDPSGKVLGLDDVAVAAAGIVVVGLIQGAASAAVDYRMHHSFSRAIKSFNDGFATGTVAASSAVLLFALGQGAVVVGAGVAIIDIGLGFLNAATAVPSGAESDFTAGLKATIGKCGWAP